MFLTESTRNISYFDNYVIKATLLEGLFEIEGPAMQNYKIISLT